MNRARSHFSGGPAGCLPVEPQVTTSSGDASRRVIVGPAQAGDAFMPDRRLTVPWSKKGYAVRLQNCIRRMRAA